MTELPPPQQPDIQPKKRGLKERISIVWLVPLLALFAALAIAYDNYASRGPLIEVTFENAAGIKANETLLKYRNIRVGIVEDIRFSEGLDHIVLHVRVDSEMARFLDTDTEFWVVRPEFTESGVSGLDTLLSGVYLEASWDATPGEPAQSFTGLNHSPLLGIGEKGTKFTLFSRHHLPETRTQILYKGVQVGRVDVAHLAADPRFTEAEAVIFEPFTGLVTSGTRFWNVSGVNASLGLAGVDLKVQSLTSLTIGGLSFDTAISGGDPLAEGDRMEVYASEAEAREALLVGGQIEGSEITLIFNDNILGLDVGAPLEFEGLRIGEVTSVSGLTDPERFGDDRVRLIVSARVEPSRIGLAGGVSEEVVSNYLTRAVENGLRARLTNASLLGGLKVELVVLPDAPPDSIDREALPFPIFPTAPANVADMSAAAGGLFERVNKLPIEQVLHSAIDLLNSGTNLVKSDDIRSILSELKESLSSIRNLVQSEEIQSIPHQVDMAFQSVDDTLTSVSTVTNELEQAAMPIVSGVRAALSDAGSLVEEMQALPTDIRGVVENISGLITDTRSLVDDARNLPMQDLAARTDTLLGSVNALIDQDSTRALPAALNASLTQLADTLAQLRDGALVQNASATLASARAAAEALAGASENLPALARDLRNLAAQAQISLTTLAPNSPVVSQSETMIRQIRDAADAIESLAKSIERNPNSLLTGR